MIGGSDSGSEYSESVTSERMRVDEEEEQEQEEGEGSEGGESVDVGRSSRQRLSSRLGSLKKRMSFKSIREERGEGRGDEEEQEERGDGHEGEKNKRVKDGDTITWEFSGTFDIDKAGESAVRIWNSHTGE